LGHKGLTLLFGGDLDNTLELVKMVTNQYEAIQGFNDSVEEFLGSCYVGAAKMDERPVL
jgi:hypothetical protein